MPAAPQMQSLMLRLPFGVAAASKDETQKQEVFAQQCESQVDGAGSLGLRSSIMQEKVIGRNAGQGESQVKTGQVRGDEYTYVIGQRQEPAHRETGSMMCAT